ncbi:MAG: HAD-IB family hydrolase [Treponema sp.]|nr:HAD-IB family hydrolase [Treponema sp.]
MKAKTHVFDVDHTVIKRSSMGHFLREALAEGIVRPWQIRRLPLEWAKYKLGRLDLDFIEKAVEFIAGIEKTDLERVAETCFERRIRRDIYPGAARLIGEARERGERVVFATSSFHVAIRPLERFLGVEGSLACELEFLDGRTSGRLVGRSLLGPKKRDAVRDWLERDGISPGDVCFYSDSHIDIPLLEFCGTAVAVNPDRVLKEKARKHGWKAIYF